MKATRIFRSLILVISVLRFGSISAQSIPTLSDQFVPKFSLSTDALDILQRDLSLYLDKPISDQLSIEMGLRSRINFDFNPRRFRSVGATARLKWFMPMSSGRNTMMSGVYLAGGLGYGHQRASRIDGSGGVLSYREIGLNLDVGYQWLIADRATVDVFLRNTFYTERFMDEGPQARSYSQFGSRIRLGLRLGGVFGKRKP